MGNMLILLNFVPLCPLPLPPGGGGASNWQPESWTAWKFVYFHFFFFYKSYGGYAHHVVLAGGNPLPPAPTPFSDFLLPSVCICFVGLMYIKLLHFIPLRTKIHKQTLQTDLRTFPKRISWENLTKNQSFCPLITSLIHVPLFFFMFGENNIDDGHYWDLNTNSYKP